MPTIQALAAEVLNHPVKAACVSAAQKLVGLMPATVVGEPDDKDAQNLADDLMAIAAIFDPVIEAVGAYAKSVLGGIGEKDLKLFQDQVRAALEGNASYVLVSRGEELAEERAGFDQHQHDRCVRAEMYR